jgi:uncharacterized protein (TIGR03437 family)
MRHLHIVFVVLFAALAVRAQSLSFGNPTAVPIFRGPLAIMTSDFNHDGHPDLAVMNSTTSQLSVFLGTGDGTFSEQAPINANGCGAAYMTAGGFANINQNDLLVVCAFGNVMVFPNTGGGSFLSPVTTTVSGGAWAGNLVAAQIVPATGDFNRDGRPDLVVATPGLGGTWYFLAGLGQGKFASPVAISLGGNYYPLSIVAGDFNGDGFPDLVATVVNQGLQIELLFGMGHGNGTFGPFVLNSQIPPTTLGSMLLAADVNGDGKLDVIATGSSALQTVIPGTTTGASSITTFLGNGKGGFTQAYNITLPEFMSGVAMGKFMGTGHLDLVAATMKGNFLLGVAPTGGFEVFPGLGNGSFGSPVSVPIQSGMVATSLVTADFNGDGRLDLAYPMLLATTVSSGAAINTSTNFSSVLSKILPQLQQGYLAVALNTTGVAPAFTNANAASFANGTQAVDSIVSAFGTGLAGTTAQATSVPLPTTLGGVTIEVKDATGVTQQAPLFYVSPTQINYAIPGGTATGTATITIHSTTGDFVAQQDLGAVAPGIFGASGWGVGQAVQTVNGAQQSMEIYQNGAAQAINVSGGETFLVLYGTGIRNHTSAVTATVGSAKDLPVAYAGAQATYVGEDQINIQLPASLAGAGTVNVTLTVDGQMSNAVKIQVQ